MTLRKPRILICTDSPYIDTGFARVGREIGVGLQMSGQFDVTYHGWFHRQNDKMIPFRVVPTDLSPKNSEADKYGKLSFPGVVEQVKPDLVLVIGDEWMVRHFQGFARNYPMVAYVPIDGEPMMASWAETFRGFDQLVLYGEYAKGVVRAVDQNIPIQVIPHGVDLTTFKPLTGAEKAQCKKMVVVGDKDKFVVGCVARNNTRKQIPRLLRAFQRFVRPWLYCRSCKAMHFNVRMRRCEVCGGEGDKINVGNGVQDTLLYLHMSHTDPAGHPLIPLITRFNLTSHVAIPENMQVGRGIPDEHLNAFYNAMDLFTLPTSGEGWGLPILEAMSAGCPVLVTDYSAHVDFVKGAGESINVVDFDVCNANNMDRALVDLTDYVMKLDRFYYDQDQFLAKWGEYMVDNGYPPDQLINLHCGKVLRGGMGKMAHERAQQYAWAPIVEMWGKLFLNLIPSKSLQVTASEQIMEVL